MQTSEQIIDDITAAMADAWLAACDRRVIAKATLDYGQSFIVIDRQGNVKLFGPASADECLRFIHRAAARDALAAIGKFAPAATAADFRVSAQRRRRVLQNVEWVYHRDRYQARQQEENVRTLAFDAETEPLWQRIRRAKLFVDFVKRAEVSIRARAESLAEEMRHDVEELLGFPNVKNYDGSWTEYGSVVGVPIDNPAAAKA